MRIIGHGIDIQELKRVEKLLANPAQDWLDGVFTDAEQAEEDQPPTKVQYYAGRYAAKEAVAKALGTGFTDEVAWLDIEILRMPKGAPGIRLSAGAEVAATLCGITSWLISLSHSGEYAVASVIGVSED